MMVTGMLLIEIASSMPYTIWMGRYSIKEPDTRSDRKKEIRYERREERCPGPVIASVRSDRSPLAGRQDFV
jgi:hypothetical protein